MDLKKVFGKRLQELRKKQGLKQDELAALSNIEPTSISNIENGRNYPSFQTLEHFSKVFGIPLSEIFSFEHKQEPKDLIKEIDLMLKENPSKVEDIYKIVCALVKK